MPKTFTEQFQSLNIWSWVRIGIVVLLITGAYVLGVLCGSDRDYKDNRDFGYGPRNINRVKDISRSPRYINPMTTMMPHDPMDMSMRDMGKMLEGKTGAELNKAFLEGMIPHHQGAIDMAKYLAGSDKPELVKLGADIIAAQQKEIDQMNTWMKEWGYIATGSTNTGMNMHMMPDGTMMHGGM